MQYDGEEKLPKHFLVPPPDIERTTGEYLARGCRVPTYACSESQKIGAPPLVSAYPAFSVPWVQTPCQPLRRCDACLLGAGHVSFFWNGNRSANPHFLVLLVFSTAACDPCFVLPC